MGPYHFQVLLFLKAKSWPTTEMLQESDNDNFFEPRYLCRDEHAPRLLFRFFYFFISLTSMMRYQSELRGFHAHTLRRRKERLG